MRAGRRLLVGFVLIAAVALIVFPHCLFAGCAPEVTRALTCFWLKWAPDWCLDAETEVAEALTYFDIEDSLAPGKYPFEWDLRNANGERVGPGVYFLRLSTPRDVITRKILIER